MHWKYPDYCAIFRMKLLQIISSQHPVDTGRRMIPRVSELLANTEGHDFHSGFSASLGNAVGRSGYGSKSSLGARLQWVPTWGRSKELAAFGPGSWHTVHYFPYFPGRQPIPSASCKASRLRDRAQPRLTTGVTKYTKPSPSLSPLHKNFPCK